MVVGDVYRTIYNGDLVIIRPVSRRKVRVRFIDTGYESVVSDSSVRVGKVKDRLKPSVHGVGFVGDGKYKPTNKGRLNKNYQTWSGVIERCCSDKFKEKKKNAPYRDCTVHPDWHNFQVFAKWYEENHPNDGNSYDLDKDIKVKGNKVYGPDTCMFATRKDNVMKAISKDHSFKDPDGEVFKTSDLVGFCKEIGLSYKSMIRVSLGTIIKHKGWTKA